MATYIACRSDELPLDFFSTSSMPKGQHFSKPSCRNSPSTPVSSLRPFARRMLSASLFILKSSCMVRSAPKRTRPTAHSAFARWGNVPGAPADSILINGRPLNGRITLTTAGGAIYLDNGVKCFSPQNNDAVRITGVLAADHGHTPRILEIHPVFAIDLITNAEIGPPDLSGTWARPMGAPVTFVLSIATYGSYGIVH